MKKTDKFLRIIAFILLLGLFTAIGPVIAQDQPSALSPDVLTIQFSAVAPDPPTIEEAQDMFIFKIIPIGPVTGDLVGTLTQHITFVDPMALGPYVPNLHIPITTFFEIETDEGIIEGYYAGVHYHQEDTFPDAIVIQHGQILSATSAYADLYLADIYYDGVVDYEEIDGNYIGVGDSGTLIIVPR